MLLEIDLQSEMPLYMQLKNQIIEGIATEALRPGDTLPSVRQLASDLGINLHTVNKAYNLLKQERFLIVHRKSGAIINKQENYKATEADSQRVLENLKPIMAESICRGLTIQDFMGICEDIYETMIQSEEAEK